MYLHALRVARYLYDRTPARLWPDRLAHWIAG